MNHDHEWEPAGVTGWDECSICGIVQRAHPQPLMEVLADPATVYGGGIGHVQDSDTSKAWSEAPATKTMQGRVLGAIRTAGMTGLTSAEAEDRLNGKHQSVSAAIRHLELAGHVVKTSQVRNRQHAYVSGQTAKDMNPAALLPPNERRVSWKQRHRALVDDLLRIIAEGQPGAMLEVRDRVRVEAERD